MIISDEANFEDLCYAVERHQAYHDNDFKIICQGENSQSIFKKLFSNPKVFFVESSSAFRSHNDLLNKLTSIKTYPTNFSSQEKITSTTSI